MYLPAHFEETDQAQIADLITKFPLATLVAQTAEGLTANHIPLLMAGGDLMIGHIAAANDLHRLVTPEQDVLAIFQGTDAYISPNWYPSKFTNHEQVPTWNYEVVHVHGRMTFLHDEKSKLAAVGRLTKIFETRTNKDSAWRMSDAPPAYLKARLADIVAFDLRITRIVAKSKLNQNKAPQDVDNVAKELNERGNTRMSHLMGLGKSKG